jgi:hypothetical protein
MLMVPTSPVGVGGAGKVITNLNGTPSATVWGTTQVSGAGVDTLSAGFTDLITAANCAFDVGALELWLAHTSAPSATDSSTLLNLYTGTAGNEVALVMGLSVGWCDIARTLPKNIRFPCYLPQGTRVSMKTQSITASRSLEILAFLHPAEQGRAGSSHREPTLFEVLGTSLTGSRGTLHTPGNAGVFSTAVNIGTTTSFDARYISLQASGQGTKADTTMNAAGYIVELSKSGGPVYGLWWVGTTTNETQNVVPSCAIPCTIPSGTQLQIRAKCGGTAEDQDYSILLAG